MNAKVWLRCSAVLGLLTAGATAQELIGLRIEGPDEVVENTVTPYRVFAEFDDGREFEVTLFSDLSVDPGEYAQIDQFGDFETFDVPGNQVETIHAEFEFNQKRVQADLEVTIIDVSPAGHALEFDGRDDRIRVPNSQSLSISSSLTIEAWLRLHKPIRRGIIVSKGDERGNMDPYVFDILSDRKLQLRIDDDTNQRARIHADIGALNWEAYHHVAGVFDDLGDELRLYVDGELVGRQRTELAPLKNQNGMDLMFGEFIGYSVPLNGELDEVRIWNVARRPHQIRCDMHRVLRGDEEGLVGYWRFDEARGQVAADSSPYGNDGVLGTSPDPDASDPAWVLSEADLHLPPNDPPVWSEPVLVPEVSSGEDHAVSISSDGLSMYIGSERDGFAEIDIYRANRDSVNEPFSTPVLVKEVSRPGYENHDNGPVISANGLRLYFQRAQGRGPGDFYVAQRDAPGNPWNDPVPIPSLNTNSSEGGLAISTDELFAVFNSDRSGQSGVYTASRPSVEDDWGNIKAIPWFDGKLVGGKSLSWNTLTLYVSADLPGGVGDRDIWKCSRRSVEAPFDKPVLVRQLSSERPERGTSISADGRTMYIVRNIGGGRHGSILVSHLEGGGGCEIDCDAIRKLKVKCRGNKLKVLVKSSLLEGTELTIDNDGDQRVMTIKRKGKGKLTWPDQTGIHTVQIIECPDYVKAVNCGS